MKRVALAGVAILVGLALTGCSYRSVDASETDATQVPGAGVLYRFCDQSTLIYVSIVPNEADNFEAFFYGGCAWDKESNKFLPAIGADVDPRTNASDNDEMNQQDERDENK